MFGTVLWLLFNGLLVVAHSSSSEESSEERHHHHRTPTYEALKDFIKWTDAYNLNVSLIGSRNDYVSKSTGLVQSLSITITLPTNNQEGASSLDGQRQEAYLEKMEKHANRLHAGFKTRALEIRDGFNYELEGDKAVNFDDLIDSIGYDLLMSYENGQSGFAVPENVTKEVSYNYVIKNPSDDRIKSVQVISSTLVINQVKISDNFPTEILQEAEKLLAKLWLAIDDGYLIVRILAEELHKKFGKIFQTMIGTSKWSTSGKSYVNLEIGDNNIVIVILD